MSDVHLTLDVNKFTVTGDIVIMYQGSVLFTVTNQKMRIFVNPIKKKLGTSINSVEICSFK